MQPRADAPAAWWIAARGPVLDVLIVAINLFVDPRAADWLIRLVARAPDSRAQGLLVGLLALAALLLPAVAAVLKRRRTHARLAAEAARNGNEQSPLRPGCLFNPIVYLSVSLVLGCAMAAGLAPVVFGEERAKQGGVFVPLVLLVIVLAGVQTAVVYRYFQPPGPRTRPNAFLDSPLAEYLGDTCVYLTVLLFQTVWLTLAGTPFGPLTGVTDAVGRLLFVAFAALLVYFPPRLLYLAEDLRRPGARLTLVLANAAMLVRLFTGAG